MRNKIPITEDNFKTNNSINDKIHTIRGIQVMLDRDLAELYNIPTMRLNQAVKRNIERFPEDFMFKLNGKEVDLMVSHFAIPSKMHLGGHLPLCFHTRRSRYPFWSFEE